MGVIEPSDLTARLYTTENRMATGEVKNMVKKQEGHWRGKEYGKKNRKATGEVKREPH